MNKISLGARIVVGIMRLFGHLPLSFHHFMSHIIYGILKLTGYRRDVVVTNIARSFPNEKYDFIKRTTNDFYRQFARTITEIFFMSTGSYDKLERYKFMRITGAEHVAASLREGRPVMVLMSHNGNWETIQALIKLSYCPEITQETYRVVYRQLHSKLWDDVFKIIRISYEPGFKGLIEANDCIRYILTHRTEPKMYVFITDQFPYKKWSEPVGKFMNQDTLSMTAGAGLAKRFGMDILTLNVLPDKGEYNYELRIEPCSQASEDITPTEIMQRYYATLENVIKENPSAYLWSHKRWK